MSEQDSLENINDLSPAATALQMITGYWPAQVVYDDACVDEPWLHQPCLRPT